jgi:hypothetical protein
LHSQARSQKIERLKSTLHLIGLNAENTHTLFVDDADDIENFDAAAHFDTHEDVLSRAANRPRTSTLLGKVCSGVSKKTVDEVRRRRRHRRFFVSHQSLIFFSGQQKTRCFVSLRC